MMGELAGIDRAAPGFDRVKIAPRPTGTITRAAGSMETRHGKLACSWKIEGGKFSAEVTVPPNTTAEVSLPVKGTIKEGGAPAKGRPGIQSVEGGTLVIGSGIYHFEGSF
jgi:alpha-L-rhamnosidase